MNRRIGVDEVSQEKIDVPEEIVVGKNTYELMTFVYFPYVGHYAACVKCGNDWTRYNDTSTKNAIVENKVDFSEAKNLMSAQATLFYYFKRR